MDEIYQAYPSAENLTALQPEELGELIVSALLSRRRDNVHLSQIVEGFFRSDGAWSYGRHHKSAVEQVLAEAWNWLESQGLLIPAESNNGQNGWRRLSRRAEGLSTPQKIADFRAGRMLPPELLHPSIRERVRANFVRGEYDSAVFFAMREAEIAVRAASGLSDLYGVKLARAAFHPETGSLTDKDADPAERIARMELFAGALGSYKNPHSHRQVVLADAVEAIEQIVLASHLLRIVTDRAAERQAADPKLR